MNNPSYGQRRSAFTLIELLVVIAIIAILAAILFPVFAQAKLAAKKSAGLAQMKQIGTALFMYEGDNDDGMPTWDWYYNNYPAADRDPMWAAAGSPAKYRRAWDFALLPYVKDANFDKATATATADFSGVWKSPGIEYDTKNGRSIGINQLIAYDIAWNNEKTARDTSYTTGAYVYFNMSEMVAPAETMFVGDTGFDGRYEPIYNYQGYNETWVTNPAPAKPTYSRAWRYGKDSANYAWLDGHASSMKGDKIQPNVGHKATSTWTAAQRLQSVCATARYQAGSSDARSILVNAAQAGGVNCGL
ncbi:prepilin-type N-terminal cleavage/methylation domain-containing protein [bacterium]|nr:MAG: prepilin-type N-terminal cleavage/methylation domain-containing protein [bacterium]